MAKISKTKNEKWGFYGTICRNYSKEEAEKKWAEAFTTLKKLSGLPGDVIRRFLDSQRGRHIADSCYDLDEKAANIIKNQWKHLQKEIFLEEFKVSDKEFYREQITKFLFR